MEDQDIIERDPNESSSDHGGNGTDFITSNGDDDDEEEEGKGQDEYFGMRQSTATPQHNGPSTPSNNHSPPGPHNSQTPVATPGLAPIYPYIPPGYFPVPMAGYASHLTTPAGDPFLTGANTDPMNYRDSSFLNDPIPDTRRNRGGVTEPFPEKLHRMLEHTEREGLTHVVSFYSHGRAFAIHKPRRFAEDIMPRFFKQTRLTSFQRQLNLYGFRRISQGPDNGGYYHELFLKGRPGLCVNMKRTKIRGSQKMKRDPNSDPNFYAMPPIKPHSAIPMAGYGPPPHASLGHPTGMPGSPSAAAAGYPHSAMQFPTYPMMMVPGPYTAAQQGVPGAPTTGAPLGMYGYPVPYYQYSTGWGYPMATNNAQSGQMPATSPVQTGTADSSGGSDQQRDTEESNHTREELV